MVQEEQMKEEPVKKPKRQAKKKEIELMQPTERGEEFMDTKKVTKKPKKEILVEEPVQEADDQIETEEVEKQAKEEPRKGGKKKETKKPLEEDIVMEKENEKKATKRRGQKEESEPTLKKMQAPVVARIETPEGYTSILVDEEGHEEVKRMLTDINDQNQELLDAMNKLVNQMEENIKKRILEVEKRLNAKIENIAESAGIIINTTTRLSERVTQDHVNITDKLNQISHHMVAYTAAEDPQEDAEPAKKTTVAKGKKATTARK